MSDSSFVLLFIKSKGRDTVHGYVFGRRKISLQQLLKVEYDLGGAHVHEPFLQNVGRVVGDVQRPCACGFGFGRGNKFRCPDGSRGWWSVVNLAIQRAGGIDLLGLEGENVLCTSKSRFFHARRRVARQHVADGLREGVTVDTYARAKPVTMRPPFPRPRCHEGNGIASDNILPTIVERLRREYIVERLCDDRREQMAALLAVVTKERDEWFGSRRSGEFGVVKHPQTRSGRR